MESRDRARATTTPPAGRPDTRRGNGRRRRHWRTGLAAHVRAGVLSAVTLGALAWWIGTPGGADAQPAGAPPAQAPPPQPVTVTVDLFEWGVVPSVASVPAGVPVRFVARNAGGISHQLALSAPSAQGAVLAPGESHTLELTFGAPGALQLFCPIGNVPLLPGVSHRQQGMEAAFEVTAPPPGVTVQATPAIAPAPTLSALTAPGADEDRMGLPPDYAQRFGTFYVFDRSDNRQVRHVFGNAQALAARPGQRYPYGSVLVMETWRAKLGPDAQPEPDAAGRYQKEELTGVFVMRKERGFGEKYGPDRTGEWEYVAYRPDLSGLATPPERSQACAQCHLVASDGGRKDWVVRGDLFFAQRAGPLSAVPGLPRTGGHDLLLPGAPGAGLLPFGLAAAGPALVLSGLALRSLRSPLRRRHQDETGGPNGGGRG
jgi:hypothetical protein